MNSVHCINSGFRCLLIMPVYQLENGPHTTGTLDIGVKDSRHRKELIDYFATKVTGLGVAKTFIHIDNLTYEHGFEMRPNAWKY